MMNPGQARIELLAQEGLHVEVSKALYQCRHESGKLVNLLCHSFIIAGTNPAWQPGDLVATEQDAA